jgi:hypothetical protein
MSDLSGHTAETAVEVREEVWRGLADVEGQHEDGAGGSGRPAVALSDRSIALWPMPKVRMMASSIAPALLIAA